MSEPPVVRYAHRLKCDGSHDSICLACLETISSQQKESDLPRDEEDHVCRYSFPTRRAALSGRDPRKPVSNLR